MFSSLHLKQGVLALAEFGEEVGAGSGTEAFLVDRERKEESSWVEFSFLLDPGVLAVSGQADA
jgi:hypothetical protein